MKKLLVRSTDRKTGRKIYISPKNSELKYLSYARIILNNKLKQIKLNSKNEENAIVCFKGICKINIENKEYELKPLDSIYIPIETEYSIKTEDFVDIVQAGAKTKTKTEVKLVKFDEIKNNPEFTTQVGKENYIRTVHKLIDKNVNAKRLLVGVTFGAPGNWTSFPPHEHAKSKEEIYVYFNMPAPSFGIQLVYTGTKKQMEFLKEVYEGDAVIIPAGYHPNVSVPGYSINYLWLMAGLEEDKDRVWLNVNTQKEFIKK